MVVEWAQVVELVAILGTAVGVKVQDTAVGLQAMGEVLCSALGEAGRHSLRWIEPSHWIPVSRLLNLGIQVINL